MNLIALQTAIQGDSLDVGHFEETLSNLKEQWAKFGSTALALAVLTVINGILPSSIKARIAFWRWNNPLPGCRAFSDYLRNDPRIDLGELQTKVGIFPSEAGDQNARWYKIYRSVQSDVVVNSIHRDFLFTRDYAALSFMLFVIGAGVLNRSAPWMCLALLVQYLLTALAAQHYGKRLVTTSVAAWLTNSSNAVASSSTSQLPATP